MKKSLAVVDPKMAREAVRKHLARLQSSSNALVFTAQKNEEAMVQLLVDMAQDALMPPALRRACANDVLVYARGSIKPFFHDGHTIDSAAPGSAGLGATVGQELEAARQTARLHEQLNMLVGSNVHPSLWPDDVKSISSGLIDFYDAQDHVIDGKVSS